MIANFKLSKKEEKMNKSEKIKIALLLIAGCFLVPWAYGAGLQRRGFWCEQRASVGNVCVDSPTKCENECQWQQTAYCIDFQLNDSRQVSLCRSTMTDCLLAREAVSRAVMSAGNSYPISSCATFSGNH